MAADLATSPPSGIDGAARAGTPICRTLAGSPLPERELLFDVNDFDETLAGPFEWDLKRLAASLEVASRVHGCFDSRTARDDHRGRDRGVPAGHPGVALGLSNSGRLVRPAGRQRGDPTLGRRRCRQAGEGVSAQRRQGFVQRPDRRPAAKLTRTDADGLHFVSDPPLLVPVAELVSSAVDAQAIEAVDPRDPPQLPTDPARGPPPPPGVLPVRRPGPARWSAWGASGPVPGWRCSSGRVHADTLILQVKEAEASALERFAGRSACHNEGQRVVEGPTVDASGQ